MVLRMKDTNLSEGDFNMSWDFGGGGGGGGGGANDILILRS